MATCSIGPVSPETVKYTHWMTPAEYWRALGIAGVDGDFKAKLAWKMAKGRKFYASVLFTGFDKKHSKTFSQAKEVIKERKRQAAYALDLSIEDYRG